ncbi:MAG: cysteine--tRNA ligase [bacterium]
MRTLMLFNTLSRSIETFKPLNGKNVGMYSCGLTVYNDAHIGNLRAYVVADILKRVLIADGYSVHHVMNITDVGHLTDNADAGEDKVEQAAAEKRESALEITQRYTDAFLHDLAALNVSPADVLPKATEHISEQIALIKTLEQKGYTYNTHDGVYFDISKVSDYGRIANLHNQVLQEGARIQKNPEKRHPSDFALWKFSPKDAKRQMEWPSPWGIGFPGWHIECSAMSMKYLGESFDIHTGGIDHIPVHHTNEIAQSEAATGKPFVKYWVHNEFLLMNEEKMAKSKGGFITLGNLVERGFSPLAFRYFALTTHYRKPLSFSWDALSAAQKAYDALTGRIRMLPVPKGKVAEYETRFFDAANEDLNIPKALGIMWEMLKSDVPDATKHAALNRFDAILGLGLADLQPLSIPDEIRALVAEREQVRAQKDFTRADVLRAEIRKAGFQVDDTDAGPVIRKLSSPSS